MKSKMVCRTVLIGESAEIVELFAKIHPYYGERPRIGDSLTEWEASVEVQSLTFLNLDGLIYI